MNRRFLVEIEPQELQFVFELKKQSSCSVQLTNISDDCVAFKVKTTSPKRYCVRPNTGIILPRSACDFTVTMQAQKEAPPDMQLKDKFLIQCAIVPYGTTDEDIVPSFFSKENGKYVQENKLKVVLVSPPHSPISKPVDATLNLEHAYKDPEPDMISKLRTDAKQELESSTVASETNGSYLNQMTANEVPNSEEISSRSYNSLKHEVIDEIPKAKEISLTNHDFLKHEAAYEVPIKSEVIKEDVDDDLLTSKDSVILTDGSFSTDDKLVSPLVNKDVEALKLKLNDLERKLNEAEEKIMRLREESIASTKERDTLQQKIALLRKNATKVQIGFPFSFVVFIALVGLALGYLLHH